jgi:hypothetical protein
MNFDNLVVQIFVITSVITYHRQLIYVESICLKIGHFYGEFDPGSG